MYFHHRMTGIRDFFTIGIIHMFRCELDRLAVRSKQFKFIAEIELVSLIKHSIPLFIAALHNCNNIGYGCVT